MCWLITQYYKDKEKHFQIGRLKFGNQPLKERFETLKLKFENGDDVK